MALTCLQGPKDTLQPVSQAGAFPACGSFQGEAELQALLGSRPLRYSFGTATPALELRCLGVKPDPARLPSLALSYLVCDTRPPQRDKGRGAHTVLGQALAAVTTQSAGHHRGCFQKLWEAWVCLVPVIFCTVFHSESYGLKDWKRVSGMSRSGGSRECVTSDAVPVGCTGDATGQAQT